jgi:hypothetical protein
MKMFLSFLVILFFMFQTYAQDKTVKTEQDSIQLTITDSSKVKTLDGIIKTLYSVISGDKGIERNWKLFKYLFKPDAKLIASGKSNDNTYNVRYMSPDDYIESAGPWLLKNGFFEKEIHRTVDTFGNMTHVFSSYESFVSQTETNPFMRGINSIQLLNDGERWWIINIYWAQES